ncbi:hypothetical protein PLESTB_001857600 [Pleodorina starrii]|uniref:Uncharacterized protein n=1 Tax=Pleodorina starrii TaxID=330485 RepID=A0A9W6C1F8_9CHLO|nr:hypothetical protein PLESTB_001857600 [Pleodorina starrii]
MVQGTADAARSAGCKMRRLQSDPGLLSQPETLPRPDTLINGGPAAAAAAAAAAADVGCCRPDNGPGDGCIGGGAGHSSSAAAGGRCRSAVIGGHCSSAVGGGRGGRLLLVALFGWRSLSLNAAAVQRHHVVVWALFAPKLMFEVCVLRGGGARGAM